MNKLIIVTALLALTLSAEEKHTITDAAKAKVAVECANHPEQCGTDSKPAPTVEQLQVEIASVKADLALIEAKAGWCAQELQLWNNIPVMETRLKLAIESRKADERKQALAARAKATPAPALAAKEKK